MGTLYLADNYGNYQCSEIVFGENDTYDALNSERIRDDTTEEFDDYNCFGFALGTYNWGVPYITHSYLDELKESNIIKNSDIVEYELQMVEEIAVIAKERFHVDLEYDTIATICDVIMNGDFADTFALEIAKRHMLSTFKDLRLIGSFDELEKDEYGIVYAGGNFDFHYAKYIPSEKCYIHKMGRLEPEIIFNEEDVFGERYCSKRLYFAKKVS